MIDLPSDPSAWLVELAGLAAIALLAGLIRGFAGFGAGLVMAPLFSLMIGPSRAVPLLIALEWIGSLRLVPEAWPAARRGLALRMGLAACLTLPVGMALLTRFDPEWTRRLIGLTVILSTVALVFGTRGRRRPGTGTTVVAGLSSGLLTGFGGIGGPPVILLMLSGPAPPRENRATLILFFAITQVAALALFALQDLVPISLLRDLLLLGPVFFLATHLGAGRFRRAGGRGYRPLALLILLLAGLAGLLL